MILKNKRIILGSNSPRRRELLKYLDIDFTVDTGNTFEEKFDPATPHEEVPLLMAEGKSEGFHRELEEDEILITADTMVLCDGKILGKPHSHEEAIGMLQLLSDKWHQVITGVCIKSPEMDLSFSDTTEVHFKELTDEEINYYVDQYKPYDKAGAYGIQEWIGYIGIDCIEGSYFNIVGLPVQKLYMALQKFEDQ